MREKGERQFSAAITTNCCTPQSLYSNADSIAIFIKHFISQCMSSNGEAALVYVCMQLRARAHSGIISATKFLFVCFYLRILNSFIYPHSKSYSAVFTAPHIYLIKMRNPEKVNQKYLGPLWISQHLEAVVLQGKKFYSWSDVKS